MSQHVATREWLASVRCDEQLWLRPAGELRRLAEAEPGPTQPHDQLDELVAVLDGRGIEVVVVDQSRSDVGLAVCRVLAPGLRHFWRRTAPGRLYDVPVALGWVAERADEGDLNPWNVFV